MKTYSTAAQNELNAGTAVVSGAVFIDLTPAFRVWGGYGDLTISGAVYKGIGDQGMVSVADGSLGTAEQGGELKLSGVDPDVLALLDYTSVRGASVVVWELVFDASGSTLLASNVARRGRIDRMPREDTAGGTAVIRAMIEGAARGLGRRSARMRTDADQRLFLGTDGGFKRIAYAGQKQLYLGGKPPTSAGSATGGSPVTQTRPGGFERSQV